jgi:DNA topoisomerase-2
MTTEKDKDTEREFQQKSQLDHCKIRPGMYIGSVELDTIPMYVMEEDKFILREIRFTTGLLKIFDEILVNATDHHTNHPKLVKNIKVTFDIKTGEMSVENDGPGISIVEVDTLHDGKMYKPQAIFSQFLSGDNFDDDKTDKSKDFKGRIVGGQNGLGSKVTAAFSNYFNFETYDDKRGILYKQEFKDRLTTIIPPVLKECKSQSYTKITFLPTYKAFGYKKYTEKYGNDIFKLVQARAYHTAAFVGKNCDIWFQGEKITFPEIKPLFQTYAEMYLTNEWGSYSTTLVHPKSKALNLEVIIGISDGHFRNSSIINGISVYQGGNHIKHITNEIVQNIMPKIENITAAIKNEKKIHPTIILNNLFIFVKGSIPDPKFESQTKSLLNNPLETFSDFKFKANEWKPIWSLLEPHIMETLIGKLKDKSKSRVTRGKIMLKKGSDAEFAGDKKEAHKCMLFIAEGDSALGLIDDGINHEKTTLQRNYCGTYSIQGVPINARKEIATIPDVKNNTFIRIRNEKLQSNKRFEELVKLLGLDYEKKYTFDSAEGEREMKTLRYGKVIVATDADVDGKGQIFGLLLNFFTLFWPDLIKREYITRFNTPIIRAFPNNKKDFVMEFYSINQFEMWIEDKFNGSQEDASKKYSINYYKGLAGNDTNEIVPTFSNFERKLTTYSYDENAHNNLEVYFGKSTDDRKEVLAVPISKQDILDCDKSNTVSISAFLKTDVKEFQRDNILRKLPHIMDGLVPSRRKSLFSAKRNAKMQSEKIKVVNFTGYVMENAGYEHGDASLNKTIIKMAQTYCGAKNLPLLTGCGRFGTRFKGGKDAGSARYIYIKSNKDLINTIFPKEDDCLLPYVFDDGKRLEPEYYCPIIPMAILESMHIPATGWVIHLWARDFSSVLKNVRNMITGKSKKCKKLGIWMRGNNCDIRVASDGKEYMVGKYTYDQKKNIITITELPISIFNDSYIKKVMQGSDGNYIKEVKSVVDHSNYDEVKNVDNIKIEVKLMPGAMETIKNKYDIALKSRKTMASVVSTGPVDTTEVNSDTNSDTNSVDDLDLADIAKSYIVDPLFDPIEEFFKLRLCINSNLNVKNTNGEVLELNYYGTIVNMWFDERKKLYEDRIKRMVIIAKLYIKYLENIIRFVKEKDSMNITNKTSEDDFNKILSKNKFLQFNKTILDKPGFNKTDDLENLVLNEDASYNYIINLTYKNMLKDSNIKREVELIKKKEELEELLLDYNTEGDSFIGQKTWLRELQILEPIVLNGVKNGWSSKKGQPLFDI